MSFHRLMVRTYRKTQRFRAKVKAIFSVRKIASMPSYFPEKERKSDFQRLRENLAWALRWGEPNVYYNVYGFDVKNGVNQEEYIDYLQFRNTREEINRIGQHDCQDVLLRDKLLFFDYMKSHGFPVAEVFAFIRKGKLFNMQYQEVPFSTLSEERDYFLKEQGGECASFVKHIREFGELEQYAQKLSNGFFILQRRIIQSREIGVLNPQAINTLRIVTINKNGQCHVFSSVLRVGTSQTGDVDNWSVGGLAVGIQESGYLKQYGFYKPGFGLKESVHPDTGIVFSEFRVPLYREACELACRAHRYFYNVRAIGWDVAISKDGLLFIEANDNFAINLHQACDRPLKREWLEAIAD